MNVRTAEIFFTMLALAANVGTVAVVVLVAGSRSGPAGTERRERFARLEQAIAPSALVVAWLVAVVTMVGSLYFSEVAHFAPCKLCWYQRIVAYPLAVVLGIAALRRDRSIRYYVWPVLGIGAVISTYHWLVERYPNLETSICSKDTPCNLVWFRELGFVTLAYMAFSCFAFIAALLCLRPEEHS